jgi:hypothetical protein
MHGTMNVKFKLLVTSRKGWEENTGLIKGHAQLIVAAGHRAPEVSRRSR